MVATLASRRASSRTESTADAQEVYVEGIQKWFEVRRQYIQWVDGHLAQMQIATDITTRKQAQELARQQDEKLQFTSRLMTMGEMASSLAHELNQPLAAINNYCSGTTALVRAGKTSRDQISRAIQSLANVDVVPVGLIFSMAPRRRRGGYPYYYEQYRPQRSGHSMRGERTAT